MNRKIAVPTAQEDKAKKASADSKVSEAEGAKDEQKKLSEKSTATTGKDGQQQTSTKPSSPATDPAGTANGAAGQGQSSSGVGSDFNAAKAIKEAMAKMPAKANEKYPMIKPIIKMKLRYKPMEHITNVPNYFKYVGSVYTDSLNFDFHDCDYSLVEKDKVFLKELNTAIAAANSKDNTKSDPLMETELAHIIDSLEKIYQKTRDKQDSVMLKHFFLVVSPALSKKVPQKLLTSLLLPYWKQGKRFTRKLWENPDTNDPDMTAAFRKRNEPPKKMETRRNEQTLKQKL